MLETGRLRLRPLTVADAALVLRLLNEPSFLRNIGDRGVRTEPEARKYLEDGTLASYAKHGYGMYAVELKATGAVVGLCGLVKRDYLDDPDVGFAFFPEFWLKGYAYESAAAVVAHAFDVLGLKRILAITSPDNAGSIRVLEKLGLRFERMITPPGSAETIRLFTSHR